MSTYFDTNALDEIWGLFDSAVRPEQAMLEAGKTAYKLSFSGLETAKAKAAFANLNRVNDKQKLFANIQGVYGETKDTQDLILTINEASQDELLAYLQDKGVKLSGAPLKTKEQKSNERIEWSKELGVGIHKDLEAVYNKFDGNKSLKTQIRAMQRDFLNVMQVDGAKNVSTEALDIRLNNFVKEANANAEQYNNIPAQNILAVLQERLEEATVTVEPKEAVRGEKYDKLIKMLNKMGEKDLVGQLNNAADNPSRLAEKLDEIAASNKLGYRAKGPLRTLQASLNVERSASFAL